MKNFENIKKSVDLGLIVHWKNDGYKVVKDKKLDNYYLEFTHTGNITGLFHLDGLNNEYQPEDFYLNKGNCLDCIESIKKLIHEEKL